MKALCLRKLEGEYFYNRLLVILTVNCGEFLQRTLSNFDGELW